MPALPSSVFFLILSFSAADQNQWCPPSAITSYPEIACVRGIDSSLQSMLEGKVDVLARIPEVPLVNGRIKV
jgi:hypothetical protein